MEETRSHLEQVVILNSDIVQMNQIDSTMNDGPHDGTLFGSFLTNVQNNGLAKRMFKFLHILRTDRRVREKFVSSDIGRIQQGGNLRMDERMSKAPLGDPYISALHLWPTLPCQ